MLSHDGTYKAEQRQTALRRAAFQFGTSKLLNSAYLIKSQKTVRPSALKIFSVVNLVMRFQKKPGCQSFCCSVIFLHKIWARCSFSENTKRWSVSGTTLSILLPRQVFNYSVVQGWCCHISLVQNSPGILLKGSGLQADHYIRSTYLQRVVLLSITATCLEKLIVTIAPHVENSSITHLQHMKFIYRMAVDLCRLNITPVSIEKFENILMSPVKLL